MLHDLVGKMGVEKKPRYVLFEVFYINNPGEHKKTVLLEAT